MSNDKPTVNLTEQQIEDAIVGEIERSIKNIRRNHPLHAKIATDHTFTDRAGKSAEWDDEEELGKIIEKGNN